MLIFFLNFRISKTLFSVFSSSSFFFSNELTFALLHSVLSTTNNNALKAACLEVFFFSQTELSQNGGRVNAMPITVKLANGTQHTVDVSDFGVTVTELKKQLEGALSIPADEQRVILRGKVLKDDCVLSAVGMEEGSVIHVVRSKKAAAPAAGPASASTQASPSTGTPASTPSAPAPSTAQSHSSQAEAPANPYAALMSNFGAAQPQQPAGGANAFFAGGNPYANFGMGTGMGGAEQPLPPHIVELMQTPVMQQMMQQALSDPQFTQHIIQSSPLLSNLPPAQQQAFIQMMRNPQVMQQMMDIVRGSSASGGLNQFGAPANQQNQSIVPPTGGFNPAWFAPPPPPPQGNPREIYREQLQQLREMGFPNEDANIAALQQAQGNVQFALERLLGA